MHPLNTRHNHKCNCRIYATELYCRLSLKLILNHLNRSFQRQNPNIGAGLGQQQLGNPGQWNVNVADHSRNPDMTSAQSQDAQASSSGQGPTPFFPTGHPQATGLQRSLTDTTSTSTRPPFTTSSNK